MKERILEFISYLGISNREFEIKCGMSNGYINSMRKGLGTEKINNVLKAYPNLNRIWLMTGEGTMLKMDATASSIQEAEAKQSQQIQGHGNCNNINGNNNNDNSVITALLDQLKEKDEQISRLIKIIENKG